MKDLTKGNDINVIIQFAIPIFLANVLQLTYSFVDTRMVGEFLGDHALAAVGLTNPLNTLIVGLLTGLTNGFAVITARFFGAHDENGVRRAVAASYVLGVICALVLTVLSVTFLYPMLRILNTPDNLIEDAHRYIVIIFAGMIISVFYNVCMGILRAIGDTVTPLIFLALSAVLNIAGDYICLAVLDMNVEGAAYATLVSQMAAGIACIIYSVKRYECICFTWQQCRVDSVLARSMMSSGFSMGFMNSIVSLGTVSLQGAINTLGDSYIVAHSAARKITELFMMIFSVFGMTMATFCGQNIGAGRTDRVRKGIWHSILISWVWCVMTATAAWLAGPWFIHLVTGSSSDEVLATGALYLRVDTLFYFVPAVIAIIRNAMQGIGDHSTPIISSTIELIGKVLIAIMLVPYLRYTAIIIAEPIVWILMVIPLIVQILRNPALKPE